MSQRRRIGMLVLALGLALGGAPGPASGADAPRRTFDAPIDRVWTVTESVLASLGWDIDRSDQVVGWFLTNARSVDFKDFGVYGKGVRHKLRIILKADGENRTTVTVERQLYAEERILWLSDRKPLVAADATVELGVLDAIQQSL
jgi:hypothetical protein